MPSDTHHEADLATSQVKPSKSDATRRRLLAAAQDEFTEFGLAGARVDRIAERAGANKRLIYLYFGSKEQLFDAVIDEHKIAMEATLHFDIDDLPGFAIDLFDYFTAHPSLLRLSMWRFLERGPESSEAEQRMYESRLAAIAEAQRAGRLPATFTPEDLINFSMALVTNWATAAVDAEPESLSVRRESLRLAITNLIHGQPHVETTARPSSKAIDTSGRGGSVFDRSRSSRPETRPRPYR